MSRPGGGATLANEDRDFRAWRRGRQRYAVWAIAVDQPDVAAATAAGRAHLAPYLLPGYRRQPHVTLLPCGFPAPVRAWPDDYDCADFHEHLTALARARLTPFRIAIGGPDSFASAAYLAVADCDGGIAATRRALGTDGREEAGFDYVPHVTIGLYRGRFPLAEVLGRLQAMPADHPRELAVGALSLLTYEAAAIAGPLTAVGHFDLADGRWHRAPTAAPSWPDQAP